MNISTTTNISVHQDILQRFARLHQNNRLAHAYLFLGPQHIGKSETALEIGKLLNCEAPQGFLGCQACHTCQKISHGNHPDIHTIDTDDDETIKIEQIRELISRIQLRAFEARWKVFILKGIDRLTIESANALLKTLEEPASDTLMILTSAIPEEIPDTIRSRCHGVHFFPGSYKKLAETLAKDYAVTQSQSQFLAYYAQGSFVRAKQLIDQKFFERTERILNAIVFSLDNEAFLKEILADSAKTRETLDVLLLWFRDLLVLKTSADETSLVYSDYLKGLKRDVSRYSFLEINALIQQITKTLELLGENLNVKIAFSLVKEKLCRK